MAEAVIKEDDARFKFKPPLIQTAEDAAFALLRGDISEEEFREACNRYGILPGQLLNTSSKGERPDAAFENKLPDDVYESLAEPTDSVELRQKLAEIKANTREEATKAHEEAAERIEKNSTTLATDPALQQKQQEIKEKGDEELTKAVESETDRSTTRSENKTSQKPTPTTKSTS